MLTMCRGFGGGNGWKCLDVEKIFLEEYSISILLAFLGGGYLYAKNQTDTQTVRLTISSTGALVLRGSSRFSKQWFHPWSLGGAAVLGVTYKCYIVAHFMCKNGL